MHATNAALEPLFSSAKCMKMFLTNTATWNRLDHCIILHDMHWEKADQPSMIEMAMKR